MAWCRRLFVQTFPPPLEDAFIQKVRQIVADNYEDEHFALPELCSQVGMSRSQLFRKMKALIEISPSDFIRIYRQDPAIVGQARDHNLLQRANRRL